MNAFEHCSLVAHFAVVYYTVNIPFRVPSKPHECLDLAGKQNPTLGDGVIKWLDPKSISGREQESTFDIVQHKSKFATQVKEKVDSVAFVP